MVQSAQEFIRALKAPSDPPQVNGPTKIEIARTAWDDGSFYIPNKEEVVTDWVLTRLLKDKDKNLESNPLQDLRYWSLLKDVLSTSSNVARTSGAVRSMKTWLIPLLNRIPVAPVTISFLNYLSDHASTINSALSAAASHCICVLWPLSVPKFSADTLLESFGAILRVLTRIGTAQASREFDERFLHLAGLVVASYAFSIPNCGNKKKLCLTFKKHYLHMWLECIAVDLGPDLSVRSLSEAIYDAGVETIFNVEILRVEPDGTFVEETLSKLMGESSDAVVQSLPRLFKSYVQNTRKYRGALYGQGSNHGPGASLQNARKAAMTFFGCSNNLLAQTDTSELGWRVRLDLLRVIEAENVYTTNDENAATILRNMGENAVEALSSAIRDDSPNQGDLVLSALSAVERIDYDLVSSSLTSVLPKVLLWAKAPRAALGLLDQVMEFHTKTRTMDVFVDVCLQACTSLGASLSTDVRSLYTDMLSSPLLTRAFLDKLSKHLHSFLTPGQVPDVVQSVMSCFSEVLEDFKKSDLRSLANEPEGPRKKRKKLDREHSAGYGSTEEECHALRLALVSHLVSVVLVSVPLRSLQQDLREGVKQTIHDFGSSLHSTVKESIKRIHSEPRQNAWGYQVVSSAILRLAYHLGNAPQLEVSRSHSEKLASRMTTLLKSESVMPELRVEICRTLLDSISYGLVEHAPVFDNLLELIEHYGQATGIKWSGRLHGLNEHQIAIAVLYLLMERWLPLIESLGSDAQLARLAKLLTCISAVDFSGNESTLDVPSIWQRTLRNAEFWELPRLRDAMLSHISEHTGDTSLAEVYGLLLWFPMDYLSRSARSVLFKRSIAADLAGLDSRPDGMNLQLLVREFLRRVFLHMGTADHTSANVYLNHLINTTSPSSKPSVLVTVTLELVGMHITALLRAAARGEDEPLVGLVNSFAQSADLNAPPAQAAPVSLHLPGLVIFVDTLTAEFRLQNFKAPCVQALRGLCNQLESATMSRTAPLVHGENPSDVPHGQLFLELYHKCMVLQRWLQIDGVRHPHFSEVLGSKLVLCAAKGRKCDANIAMTILTIAREELHTASEEAHNTHLESIIALTLSFYRFLSRQQRIELDSSVSRFSKSLTPADYAAVLGLVWEGLSDVTMTRDVLVNLIRTSSLLLHDPPEGSLKVVQNHWTRSLVLFADRPEFLEDSELATAVLELIAKELNDRPASLRQQDLSSLWSILGSCLADSSEHYEATSRQIFRELVSIVSGLIRLRRDLVVSTLPHLGIILRRLILCLKHLQPQLGAKQSRMVSNSLPRWINAAAPLTAEDSKAIARLLTTLATKTIVRTYAASTETQKAESLARPFSKHAAYVLGGYIDALNDPLSFLPADVRRELQPGLFALCEIMGERNRDSMMVTIPDNGGKTILKTLWREYEKQRYTGKG